MRASPLVGTIRRNDDVHVHRTTITSVRTNRHLLFQRPAFVFSWPPVC